MCCSITWIGFTSRANGRKFVPEKGCRGAYKKWDMPTNTGILFLQPYSDK